jgi:hypothetical protein
MRPENSLKFDLKNILTSMGIPVIFWSGAILFMLIFRLPGVISLTPLAWALAILVGRTAARKSHSGSAFAKMAEAAISGGLLGLIQGLLFMLISRFFLPAVSERGAAITVSGVVVCALLALLMGWKYSRMPAGVDKKIASRPCPTCQREMMIDKRYPEAICPECMQKAADAHGRRLSFFNETISGGLKTFYAGTDEVYKGLDCYVDGIRCRAREARMGGVVVERVD